MIPISKKYLQDKLILLLASANIFLAFLSAILVFLRLNVGQGNSGYVVQYRSNLGLFTPYKTGSLTDLFSFVAFAIVVVAVAIALSVRTYHIRRDLAVLVLSASALLVVLTIIISNALMALH